MSDTLQQPESEVLRVRLEAQRLRAEVDRLEDENKKLMARIHELVEQLARAQDKDLQLALQLELKVLHERLNEANRERFGSRSERLGEGAFTDQKADTPPVEGPKRRKRSGSKRTPQPGLELTKVVHYLDEADRCCPKCAGRLHPRQGRGSTNTRLVALPRKYKLVEDTLQEYGCSGCGHVEQALPPKQLVPGGRYDTSVAIQVAVDKYLDHQPLERQVGQMRRLGAQVTSQALWDQLFALGSLLEPSYKALHHEVLAEELLYADETPWRLMNKGGSSKWWMWTLASPRGLYFMASPSRGANAASLLLRDFAGIVMADGYSAYKCLEGGATLDFDLDGKHVVSRPFTLTTCWMHARRPFHHARESSDEALVALDLIAKLNAVEARAAEESQGDHAVLREVRERLRQAESRDLVERLYKWARATPALPKTKHHKGITYLLNQREGLVRFLDDARIPLDNGFAERSLRPIVLGRKNHQGSRSIRGAHTAATFYRLLGTCKVVGADPYDYLVPLVDRCLDDRSYALTPQQFAEEVRARRAATT